ncbi:M48 family metalloprotease [Pseudoruegeria aquimaris]|nr:M48 family metalloprotease [Pseudoruegeria aquimaris]
MTSTAHLTRFFAGLLVCLLAFAPSGARAQSLIRDAEIERSLKELARPLITAAGLSPSRVRIMVINDSSLNAFVIDSRHVFLHSGLIMRMKEPAQLQAVIAHELAHIANGHLTQRALNLGAARSAGMMGLLLSAAAAAAGAPDAAAGIAMGSQQSALRVFLKHTRAEEASADQSALRFMAAAGVDPNAMVEVLNIFRGQEALSSGRRDPWASSHPLTTDRLRAVRGYAASAKPREGNDAASAYWFARTQAKMQGFLRNPNSVLRRVKKSDTSEIALLTKAVAYHRMPNRKLAYANIDALIAKRPKDPYYRELKGQILLENGEAAAAAQAYAQAVNLAPDQPLILAGYGRALLAQNTAESNRKALQVLEKARSRDSQDPRMLRDLAVAYARAGNNGMASLATAERYALSGRMRDAGTHATRAAGLLPRGTSGWNRAQDVIRASELAAKAKRN